MGHIFKIGEGKRFPREIASVIVLARAERADVVYESIGEAHPSLG